MISRVWAVNGLGHGLQIHPQFLQGHRAEDTTDGLGYEAVHQKGVGGAQDFAAGGHQGPDQQVQDLVGAVAENELLGGDPQIGGQVLFQVIGVAVGVTVQACEIGLNGGQGLRGGPQGVFVGGQLDGVG